MTRAPAPASPSAGVQFHDAIAADWDGKYARKGFQRRLAVLTATLRPFVTPGAQWLDAGCGSGSLTRVLSANGAQGEAVDGSAAMIAAAQATPNAAPGFRFDTVETIEALPHPDASFDGVLCSSVLEYIVHPETALRELVRVLRPGGVLVVTVPHRFAPTRLAIRSMRRVGAWFGRDVASYLAVSRTTFTARALRPVLATVGLEVVAIDHFDPVLRGIVGRVLPGALLIIVARRR